MLYILFSIYFELSLLQFIDIKFQLIYNPKVVNIGYAYLNSQNTGDAMQVNHSIKIGKYIRIYLYSF